MTNEMRLAKRTGILLLIIGLFVFILYLCFFVPFGGSEGFLATIQQANPFYYSLAFIALLLAVVFYSLTWHNLLKLLAVKTSFMKAFQFIWIGTFVDLLIPAESVSGDISRIYLMSKESGENAGKVVASVIGHRILSGVVTVGGLVISSVYFVLKYQPSLLFMEFIGIVVTVSIVSLSLLFYLSTHRQTTDRIVNWLVKLLSRLSRGHWRLDHLRSSAEKMLTAFHSGIVTLGEQPKGLVMPAFLAIMAWFFDVLIAVLVFHSLPLGSFDVQISLSTIVIVYSIMIGIQTIPIGIPEGMGLPEISMTTLYALFGVPIAVSAVATVLIRFLTFWMRLLIGGVAVQWLGIKGLGGIVSSS
jgi:uncharacterized protein (TIRG00374 family)